MPKASAAQPATELTAKTIKVENEETGEVLYEETVQDHHDRKPAGSKARTSAKDPDLSGSLEDEDRYISTLYYGPYGTGKTTDVLSMAKLPPSEGSGKILLINAEAGAKPTALRQHGIEPSRVVPWPPRGEVLSFEGMERLFYKVADELQRDPESWLGGIWDSTTAIHDFLLTEVVEMDLAEKQAILARANGKRAGNITPRDQFLYEGDDYQKMQAKFKDLMRKYRYLPWHFAMTSLHRRDEDQKTHKVRYGPAVSPKLQNDIGGGPDIVIRTGTIEGKDGPIWYGRTFATDDEPAKDRFGVLPREMVNPAFDRIVAYVRGDLTEADDPLQRLMPGASPVTGKKPTAARKSAPKQEEPAADQEIAQRKQTASRQAAQRLTGSSAAKRPPKTAQLGSNDDPPF